MLGRDGKGLMTRRWLVGRQGVTGRPRAIGRVGEDLEPVVLAGHELDTGRAVRGVGRGDLQAGDDAGLGLGGQMGLEPVDPRGRGLVPVAGLGVDGRDDPVLGHLAGDPPGAVGLGWFDVLAGDEGEEPERLVALGRKREVPGGGEDRLGVGARAR